MATESPRSRLQALEIADLLRKFTGLRLQPVTDGSVRIAGTLAFVASTKKYGEVADSFEIDIRVPDDFPDGFPAVRETGGRIPSSYHTFSDGTLCLGSPTGQRLCLIDRPTVLAFTEKCIVPYFYNYSYFERHGVLPLGELAHGTKGIRQDFATHFGVSDSAAVEMVRLASLKKRVANKYPCPCGSGRPLGRCHNRKVNEYRLKLGRRWFLSEYLALGADKTSSSLRDRAK